MALYFNDNIRNNMLNTLRNYISGWCYVYSGTKPPNSDYPAPPTYLVRFQMQFSNASGGKMSLSNAPVAGEVVSTGTATWFRIDNGSYKHHHRRRRWRRHSGQRQPHRRRDGHPEEDGLLHSQSGLIPAGILTRGHPTAGDVRLDPAGSPGCVR